MTFAKAAARLLDNGFEPLPIVPGQKRPAPTRWTSVVLESDLIRDWTDRFTDHGVGLRTGRLVGLDIDEMDPDRAHAAQSLAEQRFGATLVRIGQWPKRLLLYRADMPFAKLKSGRIEVLGAGQQFVAFGQHAKTGRPYYWTTGETPLDVSINDLPRIDQNAAKAFLAEIGPGEALPGRPSQAAARERPATTDAPVRDAQGVVVDGRDAWLSRIAFHGVHDALAAGSKFDPEQLAWRVWERFVDSTDLHRLKRDGGRPYAFSDALRKVHDKLRLARDGRLADRACSVVEPDYAPPVLTTDEGRGQLDDLLAAFCERTLAWQRRSSETLPALGIRATVGLGKSRAAREHLLGLAASLRAEDLPHRILVFTASHALAEETAMTWREAGADVAVLRGYERSDPGTGAPMCRDLEAVRAALLARLKVHKSVCSGADGAMCRNFNGCLKQKNLREVAAADVVVAPYDALFSGLAFERDDVAVLLIDEGCWARATEQKGGFFAQDIPSEPLSGMGNGIGRGPTGAIADLMALRGRLAKALSSNGPGPVARSALRAAGLTAEDCQQAAGLELWRLRDPGLHPGMNAGERQDALRVAQGNARIYHLASLWRSFEQLLRGTRDCSGQLRVSDPDGSGRLEIVRRRVRGLHKSLRGKPILHLDATMRPDLLHTVLPNMEMARIDVTAPHMQVRYVSGSFGKSMICPSKGMAPKEAARRENRLRECVDYVRWHARRVAPGRVLVVTYQSIEAAFAGIANVETAHFNAVAGLDRFRDVALLISIGRPLPPSQDLDALAGAYFDHVPRGRYRRDQVGIWMASGLIRGIGVMRHDDDRAETLRAAICDDELIQVMGRGRGVNRTAETPLEVHVLADVALPLIHDRLTTWDAERPDVIQQMLLAGLAVESPADAAALHPGLFHNLEQAKKAFERAAFKGQNPIDTTYREMSLKSAAYRRAGRGRGWQRAWWSDGSDLEVRAVLEGVLGALAEWCTDQAA